MNTLILILDMIGIIAFAASGALVAGRHDMDLLGGLTLAFVTGIGGGTLRDLLLDVPVFWLSQPNYLWACLAGFAIIYGLQQRIDDASRATINMVDALGLAVFTIMGAKKTLALGHNPAVAMLMGMLTGCGGGMIRDILANEIPLILSRKRLYATASLAGGGLFVALHGLHPQLAVLASFVTVLIIRVGALWFDWRLPFFPVRRS